MFNTPVGRPWQLLAAMMAFFTCLAAQAAPAPYGTNFVRLGAQWAHSAPGDQLQSTEADSSAPEEAYLQQLQQLELQQGPYSAALSEPLTSLGRYYLRQGGHEQAVAAYSRALHVVRVNDGLYSERQVPLLRGLLAAYRDSGDWQALDDRYRYFFRLLGGGAAPLTELRVGAALEFLRWQREALRLDLPGDRRRLLAMIELNDSLLEAVEVDVEAQYSWRANLAHSQLLNFYLLQQRVEPRQEPLIASAAPDYFDARPMVADLEAQQLESLLRSAPSRGAGLMQQLLPAARLQGASEEAALQLAAADWYLWNNDRRRAAQAYDSVVVILAGAGEFELLHQWLGQPVELPDNGAFWQPSLVVGEPAVFNASYDVSSSGRLNNLEVEQVSGSEDARVSRLRRGLAATLFRPRWTEDGAQAVSGVARAYQLLD